MQAVALLCMKNTSAKNVPVKINLTHMHIVLAALVMLKYKLCLEISLHTLITTNLAGRRSYRYTIHIKF